MPFVKKVLTYARLFAIEENYEQIRALMLDPVMLPDTAVVVYCVETGQFEELFYSVEEFNAKYQED